MLFTRIETTFIVEEVHRSAGLKAAHRSIDQLVIDGVPVFNSKVTVTEVCDPEALEELRKQREQF